MSDDPKHDKGQSHGHDHRQDHHLYDDDHGHDWQSNRYVEDWVARDARRVADRIPILEALIAAVPFASDASIDVLDVGGGSGVIAEAVLGALPAARITLQDFSALMLARAREKFAIHNRTVRYVECDLEDPTWPQKVGGPFDLVVSGIAIHNLKDFAAMGTCYRAVRGLLRAGGCFLDYDYFDKFGGVPLHQDAMAVAGFKAADPVWHRRPIAVIKAVC